MLILATLFFFYLNKVQALNSGSGAEWAGIPTSINTSKVVSHSHSQEPVSQVTPNLIKLTIKTNHHNLSGFSGEITVNKNSSCVFPEHQLPLPPLVCSQASIRSSVNMWCAILTYFLAHREWVSVPNKWCQSSMSENNPLSQENSSVFLPHPHHLHWKTRRKKNSKENGPLEVEAL